MKDAQATQLGNCIRFHMANLNKGCITLRHTKFYTSCLIKITIVQSHLLYCDPRVLFLEGAAIFDLNTLTFSLPLDMNLSNAMLLSKAGVTNFVSIGFANSSISSPARFRTRDMAAGVCDVKLMSTLLSGILFI